MAPANLAKVLCGLNKITEQCVCCVTGFLETFYAVPFAPIDKSCPLLTVVCCVQEF